MLRNGAKVKSIAIITGRDRSVISREIKRNRGDYSPYNARTAQEATNRRAKKTNKRKLDKDNPLYQFVIDRLKEGWSPEQIAGRLKHHPLPKLHGSTISHEQIYEYIYNDGCDQNGERLYPFLRRKQALRQRRFTRKRQKQTILERISIHQRPEGIQAKTTYGHWESDTMICKYQKRLSVQYERKSQLMRISRLANGKAEETEQAVAKTIEDYPWYLRLSLTFDNGPENACHRNIRDNFELQTYFCDPYKAWQKGGVENVIGLTREYFPKKFDLNATTDKNIQIIQEKLNNRPRKSLNFLTPNEIINEQIGALNS